jgi:hypothetical protein
MSPDQPATVTVVARQGSSAHSISVAVIAWASTTTIRDRSGQRRCHRRANLQNGWDKGGIPSAYGMPERLFRLIKTVTD